MLRMIKFPQMLMIAAALPQILPLSITVESKRLLQQQQQQQWVKGINLARLQQLK